MSLVSTEQLVSFSPLEGLSPDSLQEIAAKTSIETCSAGRYLVKAGETDNKHMYLLSGEVEILDDKKLINTISDKSEIASNPLAHVQPRRYSVRATTDCEYICVDSDLLDILMTWSETTSFHISETQQTTDDDWMSQILQAKAFYKVPPANIQAMFMKMEMITYKAGDVIINQGDEGDFFYIIKSGRVLVTRPSPTNPKGAKLATLEVGEHFGEEALISDDKRNATITMLTKGQLVRLNKEDFVSLLTEPSIAKVTFGEAQQQTQSGEAVLLDVRLPAEYKNSSIKGTDNLPFIFMRLKMASLDKNKKYILYCNTERRSSVAAFILGDNGFDTAILQDGLQSVPEGHKLTEM